MSTKTVVLSDFAKELGKFSEKHLDDLRKATTLGVVKSLPDLVEASPVDTGLYAQSWQFSELETSLILGNTAPHASIIERGARPFRPPLTPLLAWAKRVLQDPSQPPDYSSRVWALAIGTRNKIEREGIQPRHVLEKAIPMIIENIRQEMKKIG